MKSPILFSVTIGYNDIYTNIDSFDLDENIRLIPSITAIKIIAKYNAAIHARESDNNLQVSFLTEWLQWLPQNTGIRIRQWMADIAARRNTKINLFNNKTSLLFIEKIYENFNGLKQKDDFTEDEYELFFKCYLYLSQLWIDTLEKNIPKKIETIDDYLELFFPLQFSMIEIIEFKDFRLQFMKAIHFFKYCEKNEDYADLLREFFKYKTVKTWQEYSVNVIGPYISLISPTQQLNESTVQLNSKDDSLIIFFDALCADPEKYKKREDYKFLRKHPLYKDDGDYVFVFFNFFIDKLYHSIKFDIGDFLGTSGYAFKNVKKVPDFLKYYAEDFAEKGLFYEIIEYCFAKKKNYVLRNGESLKEFLENGEPDYYIRDKGKIYLFEFKDVVISHASKNSFSFETITAELEKKFCANERNAPKGITQLANSLERMTDGTYKKIGIDDFDPNNIIIYPIIIFTDFTLNTSGVNCYLNQMFRSILEERGLSKYNIQPLTLIDIDNLIKFQDLFHDNKIALNQCLNHFINVIQRTEITSRVFTFNKAIHEITANMNYTATNRFFKEIEAVIENQAYSVSNKGLKS